ncbi:hypothetical protein [Bifidobacterium goeldii]|uniref:hypothetical protein n=1 Tax=Bifidobacterium goeldii TaxID=2306975 RepID=UPI000F7D7A0A|nr:hypothetical protein [Bifidobacterium goeldii]
MIRLRAPSKYAWKAAFALIWGSRVGDLAAKKYQFLTVDTGKTPKYISENDITTALQHGAQGN